MVSLMYNVCSGNPISIRNLVERRLATRKAQIKLNLGYYPYSEFEPMAFWGVCDKFLSIAGEKNVVEFSYYRKVAVNGVFYGVAKSDLLAGYAWRGLAF